MDNKISPLQKFQRQPKLYIDLPSNGKWYDENILVDGTASSLAVFSMTANDEIGFKTPDALVNGEATVKNIKSCIPGIIDPWNLRTVDIDTVLISIRMATYGQSMSINSTCSKCGEENTYDINLQAYLDMYSTKIYEDTVKYEDFTIKLQPLTYKEWTDVQKKQTGFSRAINLQIPLIEDEKQKEEAMQSIIDQINELTILSIINQVRSIEINGEIETDQEEIVKFLSQGQDVKFFHTIKAAIEKNITNWALPTENIKCTSCDYQDKLRISLDSSDFFVSG